MVLRKIDISIQENENGLIYHTQMGSKWIKTNIKSETVSYNGETLQH